MTPEQKTIVQESWEKVVPIADQAAELFYSRLFEIDSSARALFADTDMPTQRGRLMEMLGTAVRSLNHLETLLPAVEDLGCRHVGYGVADSHYDSVGAALLWTLEQGLGTAWTDEAADAWGTAYAVLSGVMRSAAKAEEIRAS